MKSTQMDLGTVTPLLFGMLGQVAYRTAEKVRGWRGDCADRQPPDLSFHKLNCPGPAATLHKQTATNSLQSAWTGGEVTLATGDGRTVSLAPQCHPLSSIETR